MRYIQHSTYIAYTYIKNRKRLNQNYVCVFVYIKAQWAEKYENFEYPRVGK